MPVMAGDHSLSQAANSFQRPLGLSDSQSTAKGFYASLALTEHLMPVVSPRRLAGPYSTLPPDTIAPSSH